MNAGLPESVPGRPAGGGGDVLAGDVDGEHHLVGLRAVRKDS